MKTGIALVLALSACAAAEPSVDGRWVGADGADSLVLLLTDRAGELAGVLRTSEDDYTMEVRGGRSGSRVWLSWTDAAARTALEGIVRGDSLLLGMGADTLEFERGDLTPP